MMLMTKGDKLIGIRQRLERAIGGDWLFDVPLWVHEWDRLGVCVELKGV